MPGQGAYLSQMNSPAKRKHLSGSPFKQAPEPTIDEFAVGDKVCHDLYGLGKVLTVEAHAVTCDFGAQKVRITSPYNKLQHL